jgi:XTP/dITP diphosphohydrolase
MTQTRTTVVMATTNPGKIAEFKALFEGMPVDLVGVAEVLGEPLTVLEDGETFEENARKKAQAVADATLMLTIADDSGLEVDALGGEPGVRSARYAGERATDAENNALLLKALADVPPDGRGARFRCVLCMIDPWSGGEPTTVITEGVCNGMIASSPRGSGGFGYDPLFIVSGGDGRTMAQMTDEEKNTLSHRARAVAALRPKLAELLAMREELTERVSWAHPEADR